MSNLNIYIYIKNNKSYIRYRYKTQYVMKYV